MRFLSEGIPKPVAGNDNSSGFILPEADYG
jgi:hypothetical protein